MQKANLFLSPVGLTVSRAIQTLILLTSSIGLGAKNKTSSPYNEFLPTIFIYLLIQCFVFPLCPRKIVSSFHSVAALSVVSKQCCCHDTTNIKTVQGNEKSQQTLLKDSDFQILLFASFRDESEHAAGW